MNAVKSLLELAERTANSLRTHGTEPVLIGALALAAHGYQRSTTDVDLAVAVPSREFADIYAMLRGHDVHVYFRAPDGADPLGGVITLCREPLPEMEDEDDDEDEPTVDAIDWEAEPPARVEVINFDNSPGGGFPALVKDALARSQFHSKLVAASVPTLEDLILFKAYAGGPKSRNDVAELLTRTRPDLMLLRERAEGYLLTERLDYVLDGLL